MRGLISEMVPPDIDSSATPFTGTAQELGFRTRLPGGFTDPMSRDAEIGLGVDQRHRLVLRSWPRYRSIAGPAPVTETVILNQVDRLDLAYWSPQGGWRPRWSGDLLPGLVRVRIIFPAARRSPWPDIVAAPRRQQEQR